MKAPTPAEINGKHNNEQCSKAKRKDFDVRGKRRKIEKLPVRSE